MKKPLAKILPALMLAKSSWICLAASPPASPDQFLSTVQVAIYESNPVLVQRSQKMVVDQFANTFESWPVLRGRRYDVKTMGNEVVFTMLSEDDLRNHMQQVVPTFIQNIDGKVRARGRSLFYRTALTQRIQGTLEVEVDTTHKMIRSITAESVPLRHLLREIQLQLGSFSYLIPGECLDRSVGWSFGRSAQSEPKDIDTAMGELAQLFDLKYERQDKTHIFKGACDGRTPMKNPNVVKANLSFFPEEPNSPSAQPHVYFPLIPLGD